MTSNIRPFLPSGQLDVGCNYWASHSGAHMWSDWRPDVVDADLAQLAESRLTLLRVFPLWPDFQPLHRLNTAEGKFYEYRFGEYPLPDTAAGRAGVDEVMVDRFRALADMAHAHGLRLIVGLVTGWMSGRLFTPPAFTNLNVISDPEALRWQGRFVHYMVKSLRDHPAIAAWDLGNECNVMGEATAAEAWLWTHTISGAIRSADPTRPIVSGMHTTPADPRKPWAMCDQAELTDFLTTHPYPIWTPYCDQDPVTTLRPQLHGTAESLLVEGIGGKPCFAEEMGSMGPFIVADELAPQFLRPALFSLWAHDCRAMLWWCAYDQNHLFRAPYDWIPVEQELGLHKTDRTPKPLVGAIRSFVQLLEKLPFQTLSPRQIEAVCLISPNQDHWAIAQSTFLLTKLAGADLTFQWSEEALRPAEVYLLPSLAGTTPIPRHRWLELLERVAAGATLYVSLDSVVLAGLEADFGVKVLTRERRTQLGMMQFLESGEMLPLASVFRSHLEATRAAILATETDGNPAFTVCQHGLGRIFLLTMPIESTLASQPGAYQSGPYTDAWRIYETVFATTTTRRVWQKTTPQVTTTEHPQDESKRLVILINHTQTTVIEPVLLTSGWSLREILHGEGSAEAGITISAGDGAILQLHKNI